MVTLVGHSDPAAAPYRCIIAQTHNNVDLQQSWNDLALYLACQVLSSIGDNFTSEMVLVLQASWW